MPKSEKYAIGVDLGGTTVKFGIVTEKGTILKKLVLDTKAENGPKAVIKQIVKGIKEIQKGDKYKIKGIGIGSPGVISIKKGTVENPPNLPGWGKVHLGKIIEKATGLEVAVENDANAAAIGEMIFGAGKPFESFIMVTLGTGVGGGLIIDKKLFRGETGGAGEIGHISIDINGKKCNCGSVGCIEAYSGINYLIEDVRDSLGFAKNSKIYEILDNDLDKLTPKVISEAAIKGDEFSINVIEQLSKRLGYAFASVCNLLDVSTLIIGGGISGFGKSLIQGIENSIKERVVKSLSGRIKVIPAKLKNDAGIQGASALVFYMTNK